MRWRVTVVLAVAIVVGVASTAPAFAHGGESGESASELVLQALAVLEVHPAPSAAVQDKIRDALAAKDQRGIQAESVRSAGAALDRGDTTRAKQLLERAIGACPDADILYISDQRARPPCVAPAHALTIPRRSVGGTSKLVILLIAGLLALGGFAIIRHPRVQTPRAEGAR